MEKSIPTKLQKMRYYSIITSANEKVIGPLYPQIEAIDVDVTDGLDLISESKGEHVTGVEPIFNLKMGKGAKLTDVISCGWGAGGDFVISKKLYEILQKNSCSSLQFFTMQFQYKKEIVKDYYWVHFTYDFEKYIDFAKSEYDENFFPEVKNNKPQTYNDYLELIKTDAGKYNWLRLQKTFLKSSFPKKEDIFVLCQANQKIYISQHLQRQILENSITGLDIYKIDDLRF